jgi:hypothetical protein
MTLYRMPSDRPYLLRFRIFSWSAIAVLLAVALFAAYEPQGVGRFTNVALAVLAGALVLATVVVGLVFSTKDALWKMNSNGNSLPTRLFRIEQVAEPLRFLCMRLRHSVNSMAGFSLPVKNPQKESRFPGTSTGTTTFEHNLWRTVR